MRTFPVMHSDLRRILATSTKHLLTTIRVLNCPSGLVSFGTKHRRPGRVYVFFGLGRPGPRLECLEPVQGGLRALTDVTGAGVHIIPAGK